MRGFGSKTVAERLRLKRVGLINDPEANPHGIAALQNKGFLVLNKGARNSIGNRAIISAGTGLGQAGIYWDGDSFRFEGLSKRQTWNLNVRTPTTKSRSLRVPPESPAGGHLNQ